MAKPKKLRLPGDPPNRGPTLAERWTAWKVTAGAIGLYVVYKIIDLAFEWLTGGL